MTNYATTLSNRALVALLTLLFSATMISGAVGPAYSGGFAGQQTAAALDNAPGKPSNSLA